MFISYYFRDPYNDTNGSIKEGAEINGYYIINENAQKIDDSQPNSTNYWDAINGGDFKIVVGDYEFISRKNERVQFTICDNAKNANGDFDSWNIYANYVDKIGPELQYSVAMFLSLYNEDEATINNTNIIKKPNLENWSSKRVGIAISTPTGNELFIAGEVKSLK